MKFRVFHVTNGTVFSGWLDPGHHLPSFAHQDFSGNALWDRRSRKVSTNSRVSQITEYSFQLCVCLPLIYAVFFHWNTSFTPLILAGNSINWWVNQFLGYLCLPRKNCDKTLWVSRGVFTCELFQVCNHSILISSLGMGFGHRNGVVVGCPNSGKRLNKWAKQTCTVQACLNGAHTWNCEPPFKLFPFPLEKRIAKEEIGGRRILKENHGKEKIFACVQRAF